MEWKSRFKLTVFLLFSAALLLTGRALHADLEYCFGTDALIAESPLIITGKVVSVKTGRPLKDGAVPPSTAKVEVLEVLKGNASHTRLTVESGPIKASASYPVHYSFNKDQTCVFIFPENPVKGKVRLAWGGSLLRAGMAETVKARIYRARSYRKEYLERLEKESPGLLQQGRALAAVLEQESAGWPAPDKLKNPETAGKAVRTHMIRTVDHLTDVSPEVLYTAQAVCWFDPGKGAWQKSQVWTSALARYERYHSEAILAFNRKLIRDILTKAGVEMPRIQEYINSVPEEELKVYIPFPFNAPESFRHRRKGEILTTELILQFHCYDQVGMYTDYLRDFDLSTVNPERIEYMIPYLFSSTIKELNVLGNKLIREIPGNHFTRLIYDEQVNGHDTAWLALKNWDKPELTEQRLRFFLEIGGTDPFFWKTLAKGECFERSAVKHALFLLEQLGKGKSREFRGWSEEKRNHLKQNLIRYLNTGWDILSNEEKTLQEYRNWYEKKVR